MTEEFSNAVIVDNGLVADEKPVWVKEHLMSEESHHINIIYKGLRGKSA